MKIAHLCLSCFYFDGFSYQENLLVRQNITDGHDAIVISSLESIDKNGNMILLEPKIYKGTDDAIVYRIPYSKFLPAKLQPKIRSYEGVFEILQDFKPDVIYFHGISAYELLTVKRYKALNPHIKFIVDVHSDKNNSATNWISKNILHKIFYKNIFQSAIPYIDRIFCCSIEAMDFAIELYGAPESKSEFYPLGGICLDDSDYFSRRISTRKKLNIADDKILLLQTGKINKKKKAIEALREFIKIENNSLQYIIAGNLEQEIKDELLQLIEADDRIRFVGWASSEEMKDYLCASDVYIQPGSQSASLQQSLCLRNVVVIDNVKSHKPFVNGNGWLVSNSEDLNTVFKSIESYKNQISLMSEKSFKIAQELLDYKKLAQRIYDLV